MLLRRHLIGKLGWANRKLVRKRRIRLLEGFDPAVVVQSCARLDLLTCPRALHVSRCWGGRARERRGNDWLCGICGNEVLLRREAILRLRLRQEGRLRLRCRVEGALMVPRLRRCITRWVHRVCLRFRKAMRVMGGVEWRHLVSHLHRLRRRMHEHRSC